MSRRSLHRRHVLALLAASIAGCLGSSAGTQSPTPNATAEQPPTDAPTATPEGTRTPVESDHTVLESNEPYQTASGGVVRLTVYRAKRGILVAESGDPTPLVPPDRQFLQVGVDTRGSDVPDPTELCLVPTVDGRRPYADCQTRLEVSENDGSVRGPAVPVPLSFDGDTASVVWQRSDAPNVAWRVGEPVRHELRTQPTVVVENLTAPTTARAGEQFEVTFTIGTAGRNRGWIAAELDTSTAESDHDFDLQVFGDERRTIPREFTARFDGEDHLTVRLDWGLGTLETRVDRA